MKTGAFRFNSKSESGIRVRKQEGENDPQKWEKIKKFNVLNCWMFSVEG
jgi:hypothetical protein